MADPVRAGSNASGAVLMCETCGVIADTHAQGWRGGWRAYLEYDPAEDDFPYTVVYCRECAEREFGPLPYAERRAS